MCKFLKLHFFLEGCVSGGISFKLCFHLRSKILVELILIKTQLLSLLIFVFLLRGYSEIPLSQKKIETLA